MGLVILPMNSPVFDIILRIGNITYSRNTEMEDITSLKLILACTGLAIEISAMLCYNTQLQRWYRFELTFWRMSSRQEVCGFLM